MIVCLAAAPRATAQDRDNQRISPSQNDSAQSPDMPRPDNPGEPAVRDQENQREMDRQNDQMDRGRTARDDDRDRSQVAQFDQFLDAHPEIAQDLRRNPDLVNDHKYVSAHPELRDFLKDNPQIRRELKDNPRAILSGDHDNHHRDYDRDRGDDQRPPQL
jgi:hypothetical protein